MIVLKNFLCFFGKFSKMFLYLDIGNFIGWLMNVSGTMLNYYFHCKRHLWYFLSEVHCEHNSEIVEMGRFISDTTYPKYEHELRLDAISIDFFDKKKREVHEIKKSDKMDTLHVWQVKHYLYVLEKNGISVVRGVIDYPKLKKKVKVTLDENDRSTLERIYVEISELKNSKDIPDVVNKSFCKSCSYYELCYI